MAYLVALQVANGDWHAHIVAHPSQRYRGDIDVLRGRSRPISSSKFGTVSDERMQYAWPTP